MELFNGEGNRERILRAAVRLFAKKGYANVSMREIAAEVGIKAASIYNHYTGKEALLEAIADYLKLGLSQAVFPVLEPVDDDPRSILEYLKAGMHGFDGLMAHPLLLDIARIIIQEQFNSPGIRQLLLQELIQKPRRAYTSYFAGLLQRGRIRTIDPELAAIEYHAYFIYRFYEMSLQTDSGPVSLIGDERQIEDHLRLFLNAIQTDPRGEGDHGNHFEDADRI